MFHSSYIDKLGFCDHQFKKKSGLPIWFPKYMEEFSLTSVDDWGITLNENLDLMILKDRFIEICKYSNANLINEKKIEILELVFRYYVCLGHKFFEKGLRTPFNKLSNYESDRKLIMGWYNISESPDLENKNLTIKRLAHLFPERISIAYFIFFAEYSLHKLRENLFELPGAFCWYGAAGIIPKRYANLRILHQIWCLKHELRITKNKKEKKEIFPKTNEVMEMWKFCHDSRVNTDDRRVIILKSGFGIHGDIKTSCLRTRYKLKQGTKDIPFKEEDSICDTLNRLEGRNTNQSSFYKFYEMINNFNLEYKEKKSGNLEKKE